MPTDSETRRRARKAELLARLARGPVLAHVCRAPDMPDVKSVSNWARADPAFAEQLAEARLRGRNLRASHYDEAVAAAILVRLRTGEPISAVLRDPAMPGRRVFRYWTMTQAPFGEEVGRLKQIHETERQAVRWRRYRAVYDRDWDEPTADAIYLRVRRGEAIPAVLADLKLSRRAFRRWRREQPDLDLIMRTAVRVAAAPRGRARVDRHCTPDLTRRIEARILGGASLHSLSRERGMPSLYALYKWVRDRPAFAAAVARACEFRDQLLADEALDVIQRRGLAGKREADAIFQRLGQLNPHPGQRRREGRGAARPPHGLTRGQL